MSSGYFETLRTIDGRPALLGRHLARLQTTPVEFDADALAARVDELLGARDRDQDVLLRLEVRDDRDPVVLLGELPAHALSDPLKPVSTMLAEVPGYACPHKSTERAVHTQLLDAASRVGAFEALITDDRRVIEGARTNVFALIDGGLVTPPTGRCLPGVTRAAVVAAAPQAAIRIVERELTTDQLLRADAVFITNALIGVRAVATIDDQAVAVDGALLSRLQTALAERYRAVR